jgi:hypothetical protein
MSRTRKAEPGKPKRSRKKPAALTAFVEKAVAEIEQAEHEAKSKGRAARSDASRERRKPATRQNKKGLVLYVDAKVTQALRRLALDTGQSVQELGMTALNLLFKAHGLAEFPYVRRAGGRSEDG